MNQKKGVQRVSLRDTRSIDRCIAETAYPVVTNLRAVVNNGDVSTKVTF